MSFTNGYVMLEGTLYDLDGGVYWKVNLVKFTVVELLASEIIAAVEKKVVMVRVFCRSDSFVLEEAFAHAVSKLTRGGVSIPRSMCCVVRCEELS